MNPIHPEIEVILTGQDGNGFIIACKVRSKLERAQHYDDAERFWDDALSGDYAHLLATCQKYVTVR